MFLFLFIQLAILLFPVSSRLSPRSTSHRALHLEHSDMGYSDTETWLEMAFSVEVANAQVFEDPDSLRPLDLTGMTESELLQAVGEPDSRDTSRRTHQWRYENATIFLAEGRVVAWTNSEVLEQRRNAWEVQKSISRPVEVIEETSMSWKPDRAATPRAVLDELIGAEQVAEPEHESRTVPLTLLTGTKETIQSLFGGSG